MFAYIIGKIET